MRLLLLAICTLVTFTYCSSTHEITTTSGDNSNTLFAQQLQEVINVIPTGFESFKGKELTRDGKTAYSSTLTLPETSENKIGDLVGRPCYMAKIAEKNTEKEATQLVNLWITKVGTCIRTPVIQQNSYKTGGKKSELTDGTIFFINKEHAVKVYWSKDPDIEIYNVMISVV